ncbi:hypothetical protein [Burkholderia ambifaria]|uniref:hypothetical protein n=1 Tax=Burkholderia ambifaria TaxID=152480 RepID=UPI0030F95787
MKKLSRFLYCFRPAGMAAQLTLTASMHRFRQNSRMQTAMWPVRQYEVFPDPACRMAPWSIKEQPTTKGEADWKRCVSRGEQLQEWLLGE